MPHMQCCIAALYHQCHGLRFLPVTVNQNLAFANGGGFFIFLKLEYGNYYFGYIFLALKNTQRYRVLILEK